RFIYKDLLNTLFNKVALLTFLWNPCVAVLVNTCLKEKFGSFHSSVFIAGAGVYGRLYFNTISLMKNTLRSNAIGPLINNGFSISVESTTGKQQLYEEMSILLFGSRR
ncbi:hypothetical protein L9F63_000367, partial [Diploptera punctata]